MKKYSATLTSMLRSVPVLLLSMVSLFSSQTAKAQAPATGSAHTALYATIAHMDSVLFDAFNVQDLNTLEKIFAENLEFYHDRDGLVDYKKCMENFWKMFVSHGRNPIRRDLVPGSLEVYPLPGYGAIEMGVHRFSRIENGKEISGLYKFVNTWQFKDNEWKITRSVSVGH